MRRRAENGVWTRRMRMPRGKTSYGTSQWMRSRPDRGPAEKADQEAMRCTMAFMTVPGSTIMAHCELRNLFRLRGLWMAANG